MESKEIENAKKELKKLGLSSFFSHEKGSSLFTSEKFLNRYGSEICIDIWLASEKRGRAKGQLDGIIKSEYVWKLMDFFKDDAILSWRENNEVKRDDTDKGIDIYYRSGTFVKLQLNGRIFFIKLKDRCIQVRQYPKKGDNRVFGQLHEAVNYMLAEANDKTHAPMDDSFDKRIRGFVANGQRWVCEETCVKKSGNDPNDKCYHRSALTFTDAFERFCASVCGVDRIKKDDGTGLEFRQLEFTCWDSYSGSKNLQDERLRAMHVWHPNEGHVEMRRYLANGAYNDMFSVWENTLDVLHDERSWLMKVHYNAGDTIGRGYGKLTVLKPFDAYLAYKDYAEKINGIFNTFVVLPQMGRSICLKDSLFKERKEFAESDLSILEEGLVHFFHDNEGFDLEEMEILKNSKEYISFDKVKEYLLHDAPDDPIGKKHGGLVEELEQKFFRSDEGGYKRPKGLLNFLKNQIFLSDVVSVGDEYRFRVVKKDFLVTMEPQKVENVLMISPVGDFPKVYDKLKAAGFKPYSDEESKSLRNEELGRQLKRLDELWSERKKKTWANIMKLNIDEMNEIISQWGRLFKRIEPSDSVYNKLQLVKDDELDVMDKFDLADRCQETVGKKSSGRNKSSKKPSKEEALRMKVLDLSEMMNHEDEKPKKITIGKTAIYFDEFMKKKKEDECDKQLKLFVECLKKHGFQEEKPFSNDSFDYSYDVTDMFSEDWQWKFNRSRYHGQHDWLRCHVTLKDNEFLLTPYCYNYRGLSNETYGIYFSRKENTFADEIRGFVARYNELGYAKPEERYHREMRQGNEISYGTYWGGADEGGMATGGAIYDATYKKFLAVCKDFLMELGDYKVGKSEDGYAKSIDGFLKYLSDSKAFKGTMSKDGIEVMCDVKGLVPKSMKNIFGKNTVAYRMAVTKADQYNERCIEVNPTCWQENEQRPMFQLGMRRVFSDKGDSFLDTLSWIAKELSYYAENVEEFMKKAKKDVKRKFLVENADYHLKKMNEDFNYSHVIRRLAYQHLLGVFNGYLESVGRKVAVEK